MKNIKRIQSIQLDTKNIYRREHTYVASGVPMPEVVGGYKIAFLPQWKLHHMSLVKWVKTIASIRTTHCCFFDKM